VATTKIHEENPNFVKIG